MIYDYIKNNYKDGEPILISELPCKSKGYLRQQLKKLTDNGKLARAYPGVYFIPYKTVLGTEGKINISQLIRKKYLEESGNDIGYFTGLTMLNNEGFTSQNPSVIEIRTNNATTKQRKICIGNKKIILYKPYSKINSTNISALKFLDLMTNIDSYSELDKAETNKQICKFISKWNVNFDEVKNNIKYYPDKVFRNIYDYGLINKLS